MKKREFTITKFNAIILLQRDLKPSSELVPPDKVDLEDFNLDLGCIEKMALVIYECKGVRYVLKSRYI